MNTPPTKKRKTKHESISPLSIRSNTRLTIGQRPFHLSWETPLILSNYTNLIFYSILTITTLYLFYLGFAAIQREIHDHIAYNLQDLENRVTQCRQQFQRNRCYDTVTSPILLTSCEDWLNTCMQQNPHVIKRTTIAARVIGELINTFFDNLTLKSMIGLCLLVFGSILVSCTL